MKKVAAARGREASAGQDGASRRVGVGGVLVRAGEALRELVMATGLAVFEAMLEEDREALCGPAGSWQEAQRRAYRYGHEQGRVVLGGRKVQLGRPRVRSVGGEELALPSWVAMRQEDPLEERALEEMIVGVSTRKYARSLEGLPESRSSCSVSRSSVSGASSRGPASRSPDGSPSPWKAGSGGELYVTRDGGYSWSAQAVTSDMPVFYDLPTFTSENAGVLPVAFAGERPRLAFYTTHDRGQTWTLSAELSLQSVPTFMPVVSVVDAGHWIAAFDGQLYVVRDEGRSATEVTAAPGVVALAFADPQNGWVYTVNESCSGIKGEPSFACVLHSAIVPVSDGVIEQPQ
jgi:hypothetical protein